MLLGSLSAVFISRRTNASSTMSFGLEVQYPTIEIEILRRLIRTVTPYYRSLFDTTVSIEITENIITIIFSWIATYPAQYLGAS